MDVLKTLPSKSFDLCLTDPPYNAKNIGPNARTYSSGVMQLPQVEYRKFCRLWFKEALRVSKTLVFTPGIANVCYYPQPDWILCWHKPASCSFNRMGGYNAWEPIMVYGKTAKGQRLGQDYILCNTLNFSKGIEVGHPCPKPEELWGKLLLAFSLEGGGSFRPFSWKRNHSRARTAISSSLFWHRYKPRIRFHVRTACEACNERFIRTASSSMRVHR